MLGETELLQKGEQKKHSFLLIQSREQVTCLSFSLAGEDAAEGPLKERVRARHVVNKVQHIVRSWRKRQASHVHEIACSISGRVDVESYYGHIGQFTS